MGKWTPDYYDEVLGSKLKRLVTGAISRAKLEKGEPIISYEAFVEELDVGDSFTTTMVEVLVKELADRRNRHATTDRKLIADHTANALRLLTTPIAVYHDRSAGPHITLRSRDSHYPDFLPVPDVMEMDEEDDDYDGFFEGATSSLEGSRLNTADFFDAFGSRARWNRPVGPISGGQLPSFPAASSSSADHPTAEFVFSPPQPLSPNSSRTTLSSLPPNAPRLPYAHPENVSLSRQPSVRRRPRAVLDFNDFTSRRRSSSRRDAAEGAVESSGTMLHRLFSPPASVSPPPHEDSLPPAPREPPYPRRFFPFSRIRRTEYQNIDSAGPSQPVDPAAYQSWFSLPGMTASPPESPPSLSATGTAVRLGDTDAERRVSGAPTLRRGGIRAPESMLSRHASPTVGTPSPLDVNVVSPAANPLPEDATTRGEVALAATEPGADTTASD